MSPLTARYSLKTLVCVLSAVALLLGALLISPARAEAATSTNARLTAVAARTINKVRAAHHLPKLTVKRQLKSAAAHHNAKMARANHLTKRVPGEASVAARVKRAGYSARAVKERVGVTHSKRKVTKIVRRLTVRSRAWKVMGVSVRADRTHHKYWITVIYAAPRHATTAQTPQAASQAKKPLTREQTIANGVLRMLNGERAVHGRPALTMNNRLINSAHAHNLAMAAANEMSHQLPGEANLGDRVLAAGYDFHYAGENIGYNSDMTLAGAKLLEQMMYDEGPPPAGVVNHYANIVSGQYRNVGIDIYLDNAHDRLWITEDFGAGF